MQLTFPPNSQKLVYHFKSVVKTLFGQTMKCFSYYFFKYIKCCYSASFGILSNNIGRFFYPKNQFQFFMLYPIVKSMISLYKVNMRCAGTISFQKFWNFGISFSLYIHSICHVDLTTNSQFENISQGYCELNF